MNSGLPIETGKSLRYVFKKTQLVADLEAPVGLNGEQEEGEEIGR